MSGDDGSYGILDHDFVFWLGDLNYRIVEGISVEQVHKRVAAGDLEFLRDRDQLDVERAAGRVFQGFHEGAITFPPTYKYQTGTDLYVRAHAGKRGGGSARGVAGCRVGPSHTRHVRTHSGTSNGRTRSTGLPRGATASCGGVPPVHPQSTCGSWPTRARRR